MPASVHFLLGRAGSGKTHAIFTALKDAMQHGRRAVLIVPEQFTYETEHALSSMLGGLLGIQVLSFLRLGERAVDMQERPFLSAQGRRMVLRRVVHKHKGELSAFGSVLQRAGFASYMDTLFSLCKRYYITPDMLREAAAALEKQPALAAKLSDMALLFSAMQAYMQERFLDSEDALNALLARIPHSFLAGAEVYIDGFDQFNAQTIAILQKLMLHCGSLTISFCIDPSPAAPDASLFAPEQAAFARLLELSVSLGCTVGTREFRHTSAAKAPALLHLERNLHAYPAEKYEAETSAIRLIGATDRAAEVEAMADSVLALARGGMRYRDMAVIASDMPAYNTAVQRAFTRRGIPVFFDARRGMQGHPAVELLLCAVRVAVSGLSRAELIRISKTGLAGVSFDDAEAFENYCLRRGILGGKKFEQPFPEEEPGAERARAQLIPPLITLQQNFSLPTAGEKTQALYEYLASIGMQAKLGEQARALDAAGRFALMEEHTQVWEVLMELFSQLFTILGSTQMGKREYLEVLQEALSAYQVGMIPVTADQVLFGDISRTRSRGVRALFVLGCNEGLLPRPRLDDALLDDAELLEMRALGLAPWEDTLTQAKNDRLVLYRALSKADALLWLGFSYSDGQRELVPAQLCDRVRALFPSLREQAAADVLRAFPFPQSESGGFSALIRSLHREDAPHGALRAYYAGQPAYAGRLSAALAFRKAPTVPASFGEALAKKLYGQRLYTSVSRLETFQRCPFRHFAQYGLAVRPRQEFKEKQSDIGSFSHMALEAFVREAQTRGIPFSAMTEAQANELLDYILPLCLIQYNDGLLCATPRARMLSVFWAEAVRYTALAMREGLQAGGFTPQYTEARFGGDAQLPAIESGDAVLSGVIDRVDTALSQSGARLLRVVDYKTGSTELDYGRMADGISLQLPIYLAAASALGASPTGMYYQPVIDPAEEERDEGAARSKIRMKGILSNEEDALFATAYAGGSAIKEISKSTLLEPAQLSALLNYAVRRAGEIAAQLMRGRVAAAPVYSGRGTSCSYCDYKGACRFDARLPGCRVRRIPPCSSEEFFAKAGLTPNELPSSEGGGV